MKTYNPDYKARVAHRIEANKFMHYIGFQINEVEPGKVVGSLHFKEHHGQQDKFLHGGVTASLCDIVAGFASYSLIKPTQRVMTVEIKISYFKPGKGKRIKAIGEVVKAGGKIQYCRSKIFDELDTENPIAEATATMIVLNDE